MENNETSSTVEIEVYEVPEANLGTLRERIESLNKRAKRLGVAPIELVVDFLEIRHEVYGRDGSRSWLSEAKLEGSSRKTTGMTMGYYAVRVFGETPKYDGWSFVASLEPMTDDSGKTENLIKAVPGEKCPSDVSDRIGECDHCGVSRRRSETFVVRHESGEHRVVGRNCIADFLGGADPRSIAGRATWLSEVGEACSESEEYYGSSTPTGAALDRMLYVAAAVIDSIGWVSKGRAYDTGETSTASHVVDLLEPKKPSDSNYLKALREKVAIRDKHKKIATDAIIWAQNLSDDECEVSDYLANIRLVAKCAWCRYKHIGIAVSIVSSFLRHLDQLREAERRAARPESNHIGEVKKRLVLKVTCDRIFVTQGHYGETGIHKMVDDEGNDITWFASSSPEWLEEGKSYIVKATVKSHGEYKERKQTVVNRLAIVEEITAEELDGELVESAV